MRNRRYLRGAILAALAPLMRASAEGQSRLHVGGALTIATDPSSAAADGTDRPAGPSGSSYWDSRYSDPDLALVAAAIELAPRWYVVPTLRLVIRPGTNAHGDADAGTIGLGYAAGIRIPF